VVRPAVVAASNVAVAARPAHAATLSVVGGRFTIQIASYGKEEFARQDALLLKAKNFQSFLIHSGKYWLLCVNTFSNKENAIAFLKKLPGQYRNSQVRRF
jgi:septal ring-binding cell division protein DamX